MKFGIFGIVLIIVQLLLNSKVDDFEPIIDTDTFDRIYTIKPIVKTISIIGFLFMTFIAYKAFPAYEKDNRIDGMIAMFLLSFLPLLFAIYVYGTKFIIPYSKDRIIYKFLFFEKTIFFKDIIKIQEFKFNNGNELKIIGNKTTIKFNSNFIGYYDLRSKLEVFGKKNVKIETIVK